MNVAKLIDHTLLKPAATAADIVKLAEEAKQYGFASVCVNPDWVALATKTLQGSDVKVCTVIGFPLGATTTAVKVFETENAIANGAGEVDMVIAVGRLKAGEDETVADDIRAVVAAAKGKALVKVIIETCLLTEAEKERACRLAVAAGADYVKTSTGFSTGGATAEDVALMRRVVGEQVGVKASGGVRDANDVAAMLAAGASRIGASSGVAIVSGQAGQSGY